MINRIGFALSQLFCHRQRLKSYRNDLSLQCRQVTDLDPIQLRAKGIEAIALDFDGVLASFGEDSPSEEIVNWLTLLVQSFGKGTVFILSNKATKARAQFFLQNFTEITFVIAPRQKPYPDGILMILNQLKIKPEQLLVVDDRLLTGILAAIIARARGCYLTVPLISFSKRPIQELFFMILRALERWVLLL